jgi:acyl-CoA synthetase (AMP-forming)/AMP-acid ligase II
MNLATLLDRAGRGFADRPALASGERVLADYRTLARRAAVLAGSLRGGLGLAPGDRVGRRPSSGTSSTIAVRGSVSYPRTLHPWLAV